MEDIVLAIQELKNTLSTPNLTDWLMVVITLVYVIATIFISYSNHKSAKVTTEQLLKMKEQFNEEFRPFLTIEKQERTQNEIVFIINNIGIRSARNISVHHKQQTYCLEGKELFIDGQTIEILKNDRCLQPQSKIIYSLKNDNLVMNSLKMDTFLTYESYNGVKYKERILVDVGEPVVG